MNADEHRGSRPAAAPLTDEQIWGEPQPPAVPNCPLRAACGGCPADCIRPCPVDPDDLFSVHLEPTSDGDVVIIDDDGEYENEVLLRCQKSAGVGR